MKRQGILKNKVGAVMVVGGGIAGMQAALDLADLGHHVYLVEKSPSLGGNTARLDKTFPPNDCSLCIRCPKHVECGGHPNIDILTMSEVRDVQGTAGDFQVAVIKHPRYIDLGRCIACGLCAEECPKEVKDGLGKRKAVYIKHRQAVPYAYVIDRDNCLYFTEERCEICQKACSQDAIKFNQEEETIVLNVGSIILACGFDCKSPGMYQYEYANFPNVLTSMEFEGILNLASYLGHLTRPSDGKHPERIAWLQCVGSRDLNNPYCSTVCCMYAIKQAVVAKGYSRDLDTSIFFIDMRTCGKDYERYYNHAKEETGVRFIRSRVHTINPVLCADDLSITYATEDSGLKTEEFDMVVLSVGLGVPEGAVELARTLRIQLDNHNFAATDTFAPVNTSRPGIYACGAFNGPKDIPQSVMEASAAACASSISLREARSYLIKEAIYPTERDVSYEEPRIGVFLCNCGTSIGGVIDIPRVRHYAKTLPHVVYTEDNLFTCSQDTQGSVKEAIKKNKLNRVVVASCSPRTHERLFSKMCREVGLNRNLLQMVNIREQCSWVHTDPVAATQKVKDLVQMAVARVALSEPLKEIKVKSTPSGLVIGGGVAGMISALALADQGYKVHLVEKRDRLGGHALKLRKTWNGEVVEPYVRDLINRVSGHNLIDVHLSSEIKNAEGYVGNFKTTMASSGSVAKTLAIKHGVTIIATGAHSLKPDEYLYGKHPHVLRWFQLDKKIANEPDNIKQAKTWVFILCVGSREPERPYCSKTCCTHALRNALELKTLNPNMEIYVLYRDMRAYGLREELYTEARNKGVVFIRYRLSNKPEVKEEDTGRLKVRVIDSLLGEPVTIYPDFITLQTAIVPRDHEDLAKLYKVSINDDKFFVEAHSRLKPVDLTADGVFACGLAHSPKPIEENIAEAQAAAAKAAAILSQDYISAGDAVAKVDEEICAACLTCVWVCPYGVPFINEWGKAQIEAVKCKGCGICAAECPARAITLKHLKDEEIISQYEALLSEDIEERAKVASR
jgi:heterodisulfide reductase subunit A